MRLSELRAIRERKTFTITKVKIEKGKKTLVVDIPDDPEVAVTKEERKILETRSNGAFWRWPAGGLLYTLIDQRGDRYIALRLRDPGAPTYKNHWTLASGLGANEKEFLFPLRLALREGFEEIIIGTPKGIISPWIEEIRSFNHDLEEVTRQNAPIYRSFLPENPDKIISVQNSALLSRMDETRVTINWQGKAVSSNGIVNFDPETNGLDFLKILEIKLPCSIDDIIIVDGEVLSNGRLLNAEIHLIGLKPEGERWRLGKIYQRFKGGRKLGPIRKTYPMTPVLKEVIQHLSS